MRRIEQPLCGGRSQSRRRRPGMVHTSASRRRISTEMFIQRKILLPLLAAAFALSQPNARALDIETATIAELQAELNKGTLTSEKLTEMYLARIDAYDKKGPTI